LIGLTAAFAREHASPPAPLRAADPVAEIRAVAEVALQWPDPVADAARLSDVVEVSQRMEA